MQLFNGDAARDSLIKEEQPLVGCLADGRKDFLDGKACEFRAPGRIHRDFRAADGLHQRLLEGLRDGHDLAGGLHLRAQRAPPVDELVKRPLGELDHHVVECGLKECAGLLRDGVFDLAEPEAHRDLRGDLGDRVAGGF